MSRLPFRPMPGQRREPIIRFEGIDPRSTEQRRLMGIYGGTIRQFYLAAAQSHAAGVVDTSRRTQVVDDRLRMQYTNVQGQEIVRVQLSAEERRRNQEESRELLPDWCYFELRTPNAGGFYPKLYAYFRVPDWVPMGELTSDFRLKQFYPGYYNEVSQTYPLYMQDAVLFAGHPGPGFPGLVTHSNIPRHTTHRQTFVLDLRRLRGLPEIKVDLFGYLFQKDNGAFVWAPDYWYLDYVDNTDGEYLFQDGPHHVTTHNNIAGAGPYIITSSDSPWFVVGTDFTASYEAYRSYVMGLYSSALPPTTKTTNGDPEQSLYGGVTADVEAVSQFVRNYTVTASWRVQATYYYLPHYAVVQYKLPASAEVRGLLLSGSPQWEAHKWERDWEELSAPDVGTYFAYSQLFYTWEFPNRNEHPSVPTARLASFEWDSRLILEQPLGGDASTYFNYPYMGTITITPKYWGLSWGTTSEPPPR